MTRSQSASTWTLNTKRLLTLIPQQTLLTEFTKPHSFQFGKQTFWWGALSWRILRQVAAFHIQLRKRNLTQQGSSTERNKDIMHCSRKWTRKRTLVTSFLRIHFLVTTQLLCSKTMKTPSPTLHLAFPRTVVCILESCAQHLLGVLINWLFVSKGNPRMKLYVWSSFEDVTDHNWLESLAHAGGNAKTQITNIDVGVEGGWGVIDCGWVEG